MVTCTRVDSDFWQDDDTVSGCKLEDGASLMLMGTPSKLIPALDEAAMTAGDASLDGTSDSASKIPRMQQEGYVCIYFGTSSLTR